MLWLIGLILAIGPGSPPPAGGQATSNGAIVKQSNAFPHANLEAWIAASKGGDGFDEAGFRKAHAGGDVARFAREVESLRVGYKSDGLTVEGFILKPRTLQPGEKRPVIIYNRGGNPFISLIDQERLYSLGKFVYAGYVVVSSQYRGAGGAEGQDEFGGADVDDVLNLIPLIDSLPYADGSRIGMFAWSRGGMMAYLALARTPRIAAAVIAAAPTDWTLAFKTRPEMESLAHRLIPGYAADKEGVLRARSAVYWPEKISKTTPLLLLQGSADRNNNPSDVLRMALRLQEVGHPFRLIFFEGGTHGLTEHAAEVDRQIFGWFDAYLRR
jgi:dipeptidyl aminopeptidase/acylaminoacyl peptidase